jgi:hypothetical protein
MSMTTVALNCDRSYIRPKALDAGFLLSVLGDILSDHSVLVEAVRLRDKHFATDTLPACLPVAPKQVRHRPQTKTRKRSSRCSGSMIRKHLSFAPNPSFKNGSISVYSFLTAVEERAHVTTAIDLGPSQGQFFVHLARIASEHRLRRLICVKR